MRANCARTSLEINIDERIVESEKRFCKDVNSCVFFMLLSMKM